MTRCSATSCHRTKTDRSGLRPIGEARSQFDDERASHRSATNRGPDPQADGGTLQGLDLQRVGDRCRDDFETGRGALAMYDKGHGRTSDRTHGMSAPIACWLLCQRNVLERGAALRIVVPPYLSLPKETIDAWLDSEPGRRELTWTNDPWAPVVWHVDRERHRVRHLVSHIIDIASGTQVESEKLWGLDWLTTEEGVPVISLA